MRLDLDLAQLKSQNLALDSEQIRLEGRSRSALLWRVTHNGSHSPIAGLTVIFLSCSRAAVEFIDQE